MAGLQTEISEHKLVVYGTKWDEMDNLYWDKQSVSNY